MSETIPNRMPPTARQLFLVWLSLSLQSFGGGAATLTLVRRVVVEKHEYIGASEFNAFWSLCQIAPGINLIALAVLIGNRLRGVWGIVACLSGMLLPSVAATILFTALFDLFHNQPLVQSALHGIVPAAVGLGMMTAIQMGRSLLKESRTMGIRYIVATAVIMLAAAASFAFLGWSSLLVLAIGGFGSALIFILLRRFSPLKPEIRP